MCFHYIQEFPGNTAAEKAMASVAACFAQADFSMVNLETVLGIREEHNPIFKCGPNLISTADYLGYIKPLKPSVLGLANNHTGDFGESGVYATLSLLNREGDRFIGAGKDLAEAYRPFIAEKDGIRVGVIAVCENEFGGAKRHKAGSAVYQLTMLQRTIDSLKSQGCKPVVYFHGGNEYNPFPSPGKKELYRHFVDLGASAVVAAHTHCPQGYEVYRDAPIVYSMGNFYFPATPRPENPRPAAWKYGYTVALAFEKGRALLTEARPYRQDFDGVRFLSGQERQHFEDYLCAVSRVIGDDTLLMRYFNAWSLYSGFLSGLGAYDKAKGTVSAGLKNLLGCEAHNELVTTEAKVRFEGDVADAEGLFVDIAFLQNMQIPDSIAIKCK
jgi:poly-gamma-glutamate synthesis protein (capsule biosynthesis protein)